MQVQQITTLPSNISWHVETSTAAPLNRSSPPIILIPSGEGDCASLTRLATLLADHTHRIIHTFDTPGMSRTSAPPSAYARVTPQLLASQIIELCDALRIERAVFFGCSSGGAATLALCALYPGRVVGGIVHEVPLEGAGDLDALREMRDEKVVRVCEGMYGGGMIIEEEGLGRWEGLGADFHERLKGNYVRWVRGYVGCLDVEAEKLARVPENLTRRPIFWTVGALNPGAEKGEGRWRVNFELARAAGLEIEAARLKCLHFPSVTVPEDLVDWIQECVGKLEE